MYSMLFREKVHQNLQEALNRQAAVVLVGPRQVGKTTLALEVGKMHKALYLDLEATADRNKLADATFFLQQYLDRLVMLDEIHRMPELFQDLRSLIDHARREGKSTGRYLILGSAGIDLLRQTSESLAGRIEYIYLGPFGLLEVSGQLDNYFDVLWIRGGFPGSLLAKNDRDSMAFRESFIRTYLERDIPQFGFRIPAETLQRFWTMLAYQQGGLLNASLLASSLSVTTPTIGKYIDLLVDLLLVRRLKPYLANTKKRQVRSHKIYIRDSGLLHALLGLTTYADVAGHPVVGNSFEGFAIENLLTTLPSDRIASFYRSRGGAEIDLVLDLPKGLGIWAIEIKKSSTPRPSRGFYHATEDLQPSRSFVVYPGTDHYKISEKVEVIGLEQMATLLKEVVD